jgi:hypothetical protein
LDIVSSAFTKAVQHISGNVRLIYAGRPERSQRGFGKDAPGFALPPPRNADILDKAGQRWIPLTAGGRIFKRPAGEARNHLRICAVVIGHRLATPSVLPPADRFPDKRNFFTFCPHARRPLKKRPKNSQNV